jgi:putative membrane protein
MMDWNGGWSWWWMLPMLLLTIVVVVAIACALLALVRWNGSNTPAARPTAEDILDERFARGEIDASDYRERIAILHDERGNAGRPI